jgi:hypothetical protein
MAQASDFYARNPHVKNRRLAGRLPQNTKGGLNKALNRDQENTLK